MILSHAEEDGMKEIQHIRNILKKMKNCIENDKWHIILSENRKGNIDFIQRYSLTKEERRRMILELDYLDFCKSEPSRIFPEETVYIFGRKFELFHQQQEKENIEVYIKFSFRKTAKGERAIFVSFHQANWEMVYPFKM